MGEEVPGIGADVPGEELDAPEAVADDPGKVVDAPEAEPEDPEAADDPGAVVDAPEVIADDPGAVADVPGAEQQLMRVSYMHFLMIKKIYIFSLLADPDPRAILSSPDTT